MNIRKPMRFEAIFVGIDRLSRSVYKNNKIFWESTVKLILHFVIEKGIGCELCGSFGLSIPTL